MTKKTHTTVDNVKESVTMHDDMGVIEEFVSDLATVADPDPLPARKYEAVVTEISIGLSKSSGKPTAKISYMIAPDQYPIDFDPENAPDGVTMTSYRGVNCGTYPTATQPTRLGLARYRQMFDAHSIPAPRVTLRPHDDLGGAWALDMDVLGQFVGTRVLVDVVHEPYQGRMSARINSVSPLD